MSNNKARVLLVACVRKEEEIRWVRKIFREHKNIWIVLDRKTVEILHREKLLHEIDKDRIIVFKGTRAEELTLKIYKISQPDIVFICDKHGLLKALIYLLKNTPVKIIEC
ncbi:MAG: hypothetical protein QXE81_05615 [Desulfurococcaceae archaeon]